MMHAPLDPKDARELPLSSNTRTSLRPVSATYTWLFATLTPSGKFIVVPPPPLVQLVFQLPLALSLTIRLLPASATKTLPALSTPTSRGLSNWLVPAPKVPTCQTRVPVGVNSSITLLPMSETTRFPAYDPADAGTISSPLGYTWACSGPPIVLRSVGATAA
jgi:hypothetical protein